MRVSPSIGLRAFACAAATIVFGTAMSVFAARAVSVVPNSSAVIPVKLHARLLAGGSRGGGSSVASVDESKAPHLAMKQDWRVDGMTAPANGNHPGLPEPRLTQSRINNGRSFVFSSEPIGLEAKSLGVTGNAVRKTKEARLYARLKYNGIRAGDMSVYPLTKRPLRFRFTW